MKDRRRRWNPYASYWTKSSGNGCSGPARRLAAANRQVWLPTAEDVVITKLRWSLLGNHSKDRADARHVIAVQGDRIDWDYVYSWSGRHGTRDLLDEIRQSIPPI